MIPVEISEEALVEIKNIQDSKGIPQDYYLRIGVKGSGCAGVDYFVGFDQEKETDKMYEFNGVNILIEKKDFMHLFGVKLTFVENNEERGFSFEKE